MTLHITDAEIEAAVTYADAIAVMDDAFRRFGRGEAAVQPRMRTDLGETKFSTLGAIVGDFAGAKVYPTIAGRFTFVVLLFSSVDGRLLATLDGTALTRLRTSAVSALAARVLARPGAATLAVFGTGVQGRGHVDAFAADRRLAEVRVVSRGDASAFAADVTARLGVPARACDWRAALDGADLIATTTRSPTPLFPGDAVMRGAFLAGVGATRPDTREVDDTFLARCKTIAVEWRPQTWHEAGELLLAEPGIVDEQRLVDLGDVLLGKKPGRDHADDITFFKSVGLGLEDVALAGFAYARIAGRADVRGAGSPVS
jgi:ornithine cyclodeaminase